MCFRNVSMGRFSSVLLFSVCQELRMIKRCYQFGISPLGVTQKPTKCWASLLYLSSEDNCSGVFKHLTEPSFNFCVIPSKHASYPLQKAILGTISFFLECWGRVPILKSTKSERTYYWNSFDLFNRGCCFIPQTETSHKFAFPKSQKQRQGFQVLLVAVFISGVWRSRRRESGEKHVTSRQAYSSLVGPFWNHAH